MAKLTRTRVADRIFLVRFATQYALASTFLRFQEHHESRRFSGRVFSLEQFMDWYASEFGDFTYYQDWSGFNIPSTALAPFYEGRFDPLLDKEQRLLDLFEDTSGDYYVIAMTESSSRADLVHELAHALFFTDATYRKRVQAVLRAHDTTRLRESLYRAGYARRVLTDEAHGYALTGAGGMLPRAEARALVPLQRELRAIFKAHGAALVARMSSTSSARSR